MMDIIGLVSFVACTLFTFLFLWKCMPFIVREVVLLAHGGRKTQATRRSLRDVDLAKFFVGRVDEIGPDEMKLVINFSEIDYMGLRIFLRKEFFPDGRIPDYNLGDCVQLSLSPTRHKPSLVFWYRAMSVFRRSTIPFCLVTLTKKIEVVSTDKRARVGIVFDPFTKYNNGFAGPVARPVLIVGCFPELCDPLGGALLDARFWGGDLFTLSLLGRHPVIMPTKQGCH